MSLLSVPRATISRESSRLERKRLIANTCGVPMKRESFEPESEAYSFEMWLNKNTADKRAIALEAASLTESNSLIITDRLIAENYLVALRDKGVQIRVVEVKS